MYRWHVMQRLEQEQVFGIIRADHEDAVRDAALAMVDAGLRAVEVTMTSPGVLRVIEELAGRDDDLLVGAGTVLDETSARLAVLAGARFLVSPSTHPEVIRTAHRYGAAAVPGVGSPTELMNALAAGADGVKLFPAKTFGPQWVRAVRAALPQAPVLPTGGLTVAEVPAWIEAGCVACGLGTALTADGPEAAAKAVAELRAALGR